MNTKRVKVQTYLKKNNQTELGAVFERTQGWVSQIMKIDPDAKLVIIDGSIEAIEYSVPKKKLASVA